MLKTSGSTESTIQPGKGGVGVGGDGGNEKGHDDEHSPQCSRQVYQRAHQLSRPRLWLSMIGLIDSGGRSGDFHRKTSSSSDSSNSVAQIVVELIRLMLVVVLVASRSKSRQKVKESSKSPKSFKCLNNLQRISVWRNVYRSTGLLSTKNSSFC